jgi:hypothetical protein
MNITISGYNRPEYLARTCEALSRCVGVASCDITLLLDPCDQTPDCREIAERYGWQVYVYEAHAGCNGSIRTCLEYGFRMKGGDYHVHLEDDCVPTRDALLWFSWARDRYRYDPNVFTVSGYRRDSGGCIDTSGIRRWFTPWGWATWPDRAEQMLRGWATDDGPSWDIIVNHVLRGPRCEAFPSVSRIQNIGAEKGVHVPNAEWHAANHHVPVTADDLDGEPVMFFKPTEVCPS